MLLQCDIRMRVKSAQAETYQYVYVKSNFGVARWGNISAADTVIIVYGSLTSAAAAQATVIRFIEVAGLLSSKAFLGDSTPSPDPCTRLCSMHRHTMLQWHTAVWMLLLAQFGSLMS